VPFDDHGDDGDDGDDDDHGVDRPACERGFDSTESRSGGYP
jgi:hypothetical protein